MQGFVFKAMAAVGMLWAAAASAQSFDAVRLEGEPEGQGSGRVGLAAIAGHKYLGSDERRYLLLPTIDYRWANGWFAGVGNGVGYRFSSDPRFQYGLRLTPDLGRKEHRSDALRGLGDIPTRAEAGLFFNARLSPELSLSSSLRYGAGHERKGFLFDLGTHYGVMVAPRWRLGASLSATYANRDYMHDYFGITPEQASASGYGVYEAGAGVRDVRLGMSLTYIITREWAATLGVNATSLQGDAKDSPFVRERSPVGGLLAVGYRF